MSRGFGLALGLPVHDDDARHLGDALYREQTLLNQKLRLIPNTDFHSMMGALQRLNKLEDEIPRQWFARALKGDSHAVRVIIENKYYM